MEPINVLQIVIAPPLINGENSITGPERRSANVASKWKENGIRAVVCYPSWGRLNNYFKKAGLSIIDFAFTNKFNVKAVRTLKKLIYDKNIQIVHVQGPASLDLVATIAAKWSGVKIIITRPVMLKDQIHYSFKKRKIYEIIDTCLTLKMAHHIVAVSKDGWSVLKTKYKVPEAKLKLIYNGIDLTKFSQRMADPLDTDVISIGMIAQLFNVKGWYDYLETILLLRSKTRKKIIAYIIGEGELRKELEGEVKRKKAEHVFIFTGFRDDIHMLLKKIDIFFFTSHREGLSVAILEALSVGLPIVATNVGGTAEQVINDHNGYLHNAGDIKGMAGSLLKLISDPKLRHKFGLNSRALAVKNFSEDEMLKNYVLLYKTLAKQRK